MLAKLTVLVFVGIVTVEGAAFGGSLGLQGKFGYILPGIMKAWDAIAANQTDSPINFTIDPVKDPVGAASLQALRDNFAKEMAAINCSLAQNDVGINLYPNRGLIDIPGFKEAWDAIIANQTSIAVEVTVSPNDVVGQANFKKLQEFIAKQMAANNCTFGANVGNGNLNGHSDIQFG